jgi:three-Cys-motif partner protein
MDVPRVQLHTVGDSGPCATCGREAADAEAGLCMRASDDGLPVRCSGVWAEDKLGLLQRYLELVGRTMRGKQPCFHYVDLFSGPGRCALWPSGRIIPGSPLIAATMSVRSEERPWIPFDSIHLVDLDQQCQNALRERVSRVNGRSCDPTLYHGDCNARAGDVTADILAHRGRGLSIAFLDPTGLDLRFPTVEELSRLGKADLIINFPLPMAIKRNLHRFVQQRPSKLDHFLGTEDWRERIRGLSPQPRVWEAIIDVYVEQVGSLGYPYYSKTSAFRTDRGVPLYYLLAFGRHPIVRKFAKIAEAYGRQRKMLGMLFDP